MNHTLKPLRTLAGLVAVAAVLWLALPTSNAGPGTPPVGIGIPAELQRLEAKLDRLVDVVPILAKLEAKLDRLEAKVDRQEIVVPVLEKLESKLDYLEVKLDQSTGGGSTGGGTAGALALLEAKLDRLEAKIDQSPDPVRNLAIRLEQLEAKLDLLVHSPAGN